MGKDRKICICSRCNKEKLHFGLGMCSACLRRTKRETKPSFYLGTCYSEMSRRIKTFDKLRPNYFGKQICTKEEFIQKFIDNVEFLTQYKIWQESGFKRKYAPSIDRINNELDYTLDNIQFISQSYNGVKDKMKPIIIEHIKTGDILSFKTTTDAAKFLGIKRAKIKELKNSEYNYGGWKIYDDTKT